MRVPKPLHIIGATLAAVLALASCGGNGDSTPTIFWADNVHGVVGLNEMMVDVGKAWIKK
ncbi:hypothetical protein [Enemella sp. A6]|uniref:hypothetical protein n=1 Tax=Enemella sp. A6 TaxID=3440152 RepID=UPI003EB8FDDE